MVRSSSLTSLSFGTAGTGGQSGLDFSSNPNITAIGANAFKGTKFETVDLTKLTNLTSVGADAFSNIVGLKTVKLTEEQAQVINPAVFSGVESDPSKPSSWTITNGSNNLTTYTPTTWPNTTVTVANNLDRLEGVTTIDLSQTNITTLAGGVLWGNESITKLVLPASATNWKLTEPTNYQTAPVGWLDGSSSANKLSQGIFFENFTLNPAPSTKSKKKASNDAFNRLTETTWSQVANILNMFGRVEDGDRDNLSIWAEGFKDPELDAESVKEGWADKAEDAQNGQGSTNIDGPSSGQSGLYKRVNDLIWKYTSNGSNSITITIHDSSSKPNLYRAGYVGNPFASYQVGFGESDNKINKDTQVNVTLTLVKNG